MSQFRSLTDLQMQEKYGYDPRPWITDYGRSSMPIGERHFDPRPEFIPSRDPLPWEYQDGERWAAPSPTDEETPEWSPRPEFARPPVNRILAELREWRSADWARPERYAVQVATMLRWCDDHEASSEDSPPWTEAERDHARRVLSKLAAVTP